MTITSPVFIMPMGPPGAGKTSALNDYCHQLRQKDNKIEITVFSADEIKTKMFDYRQMVRNGVEDASGKVQKESVGLAVDQMYSWLEKVETETQGKKHVGIFDGTGTWMPFCERLLKIVQDRGLRTEIILVYAEEEVCLRRCAERARTTGRTIERMWVERACRLTSKNFLDLRDRVDTWTIVETIDMCTMRVLGSKESGDIPRAIQQAAAGVDRQAEIDKILKEDSVSQESSGTTEVESCSGIDSPSGDIKSARNPGD
jgi:adenylate kinase family enzyme